MGRSQYRFTSQESFMSHIPDVLRQKISNGVSDGGSRPGQISGTLRSSDEHEGEEKPGAEEHSAEGLDEGFAESLGDLVVSLNVHTRCGVEGVEAEAETGQEADDLRKHGRCKGSASFVSNSRGMAQESTCHVA